MVNSMKEDVGYFGSAITTVLAIAQTNELFQLVEIVLACISFAVTISYTVWRWHKKATDKDSKGGEKITGDEVGELIEDIKEEVDKAGEQHGNRD